MDKAIHPPVNFPLNSLDLYLIYECVLFSPKPGFGSVLETAPVRLNERYLLSLVPDQGCPRVVDGGQFRLRVLGEEKRLLAPPKRGRGLPTQGSCRCSGGWIVPPMSMGVLRFCKDAGGHLALALGGRIVICAEGEARVPAWRS